MNYEIKNFTNCTFAEFAEYWINSGLRRRDVSVRVREEYESILRNRILPRLGALNFQAITSFDLDDFVDSLKNAGYAAKTIKNTVSVVRLIFSYALRKGFIASDPCSSMDDLPSLSKGREINCFSEEQCAIFLNCLKSESLPVQTFFTLMVYGGFRRGELCALQRRDVDFRNSTISIARAVSQTHSGQIIKLPKTETSNRVVSVPQCCMLLLQELLLLEDVKDDTFVFQNKSGGFVNPHVMTRKFKQILKSHNAKAEFCSDEMLPDIRLHDLRHTSATILISLGIDVVTVSHRLGHANPSVTLNVYSHYLSQSDRRAADTFELWTNRFSSGCGLRGR